MVRNSVLQSSTCSKFENFWFRPDSTQLYENFLVTEAKLNFEQFEFRTWNFLPNPNFEPIRTPPKRPNFKHSFAKNRPKVAGRKSLIRKWTSYHCEFIQFLPNPIFENSFKVWKFLVSIDLTLLLYNNFLVTEAYAQILGTKEKIIKSGSMLQLHCILKKATEEPLYVFW